MEQYRSKRTIQVFMQVTEENIREAWKLCNQLYQGNFDGYDLRIINNSGEFLNDFGCYLIRNEAGYWALMSPEFLNDYEPVSAPSVSKPVWDGWALVGRVRERFKELEHYGWDWKSFYNGWLEGRADMYAIERGLSCPNSDELPEAGQIAGVQWVKVSEEKHCPSKGWEGWVNTRKSNGEKNSRKGKYVGEPLVLGGWVIEDAEPGEYVFEYLSESSSLSTAAKEKASLSPKNPNDIGLTEALDYVEKYVGSCNDENLVMCSQVLNAFMSGVEFMIGKEQETAIAFVNWIAFRHTPHDIDTWDGGAKNTHELYDDFQHHLFLQSQTK